MKYPSHLHFVAIVLVRNSTLLQWHFDARNSDALQLVLLSAELIGSLSSHLQNGSGSFGMKQTKWVSYVRETDTMSQ